MPSGGFKSPILVNAVIIEPKRVCWNTPTDWNKGTIPSTMEIIGNGSAAFLRLKEIGSNVDNIPFTTPANYTLSNGSFIEVAAGVARLKTLSGESADFPITTPGNYTFDSTKIEITAGHGQLIDSGLRVGQWHLNESGGTTVADSSGNGNDGTTQNMEDPGDWVPAHLNNGLDFGGTDEFVDLGAIASFERTDSFSVEFWIETSHTIASFLVGKLDNTGDVRGWFSWMKTGGKLLFGLRNAGGNRIEVESSTVTINDGSFHHIVITYDGSSSASGVTMYVDNVAIAMTTTVDTLSATTITSADATMAKYDGGSAFVGILDEVVIYSAELSATQVSVRYNSGTGTENTDRFDTSDPTIVNDTGFVFTSALDTFDETIVTPAGTAIQYHVSSDNGVTFKYWTGAVWVASDGTFTQSNTAAVIETNLPTLAASGTFKFRALLNSDGTETPELDRVEVSGPVTFSTTDNLYVETKDVSQLDPASFIAWVSAVFTSTSPANTDIRVLFSQDNRVNWLTWSGSAWVAPSSPTTRTDATTLADAATNFSSLSAVKPLDIRVFLQTTDASVSPNMDNALVNSTAGFNTAGTYLTNIFDSTFLDLVWAEFLKVQTVPVGTITVKGRANNDATDILSDSFGPDLVNGEDSNLEGEFVQLQVVMTGDGTDSPTISLACLNYQNPVPEIVAP